MIAPAPPAALVADVVFCSKGRLTFSNLFVGKSSEPQTTRHSSHDWLPRNVGGEAGPRGTHAVASLPFPPLLLRRPCRFKTKRHHLGLQDGSTPERGHQQHVRFYSCYSILYPARNRGATSTDVP